MRCATDQETHEKYTSRVRTDTSSKVVVAAVFIYMLRLIQETAIERVWLRNGDRKLLVLAVNV